MVSLSGCGGIADGLLTSEWKEDRKLQRDFAKKHVIGQELEPQARSKKVREMRVRLWATEGYRRGKLQWQRRAGDLIENANQYLGPTFGVRLVVVEASHWNVKDDRIGLDKLLGELRDKDPGKDVDWVIGLTPALAGSVDDFDKVGYAEVPGTYFVIRDTNDPAERAWIESSMPNLSDQERKHAFESRKRHKATVCFIHEWAHTLGVDHTDEPTDIMSRSYEPSQVTLAPAHFATIDNGLLTRSQTQAAGPSSPWQVPTDIPIDLVRLGVTPDSPKLEQREAYKESFWQVYRQFNAGKLDAAKKALRAARKEIPATGWDQLECEIELAAKRLDPARRACEKAIAAFDGLPRAHYLLGIVEFKRGRHDAAREHLETSLALDAEGQKHARVALQRIKKK